MTLIIPPGFGNAAFVFSATVGTPPVVTTLGVDTSAYGGDYVDAANTLMAAYTTFLGPNTSSLLTLDRVTLAVGQDGPGGSVDSTLPPANMGRSGTLGPISQSAIVRKVTNELGRRGRGRMFLPGVVTESEVNEDGSITEARIGTLNLALTDFLEFLQEGDAGSLPLPPFLFHTLAPTDPTPIVGLTTQTLVGWIRGRIR